MKSFLWWILDSELGIAPFEDCDDLNSFELEYESTLCTFTVNLFLSLSVSTGILYRWDVAGEDHSGRIFHGENRRNVHEEYIEYSQLYAQTEHCPSRFETQ